MQTQHPTYPPPPVGAAVRPPRTRPVVAVPASRSVVWLGLGVGLLCDLALRSGVASVAGAMLVVGAAAALLGSGRLQTLEGKLLVLAAPVFGAWLPLRTSDWLLPLDVMAAAGLLVLGASLARGGSLFDLTVPSSLRRLGSAAEHAVHTPSFVAPVLRREASGRDARSLIPAVRGVLLALPVLLVLGALLASADAVFASFFRVGLDGNAALAHVMLVLLGAWGLLALVRAASVADERPARKVAWRLGPTELTVVLGSVLALFATFAASQVLALSDGGQRVLDTSGLTYAEYARSGFFQLLWVAALTVALLLSLRAVAAGDARSQRRLTLLGEAVVVLTLVIVLVAVRRLGLYQDTFGLTMLRLYSTLFAVWVGAVILGLGAALAGVRPDRSWLPGASAVTGLGLLLALNVINPEALVVRHNMERIADGREVDSEYLAEGLSLDAVPTIVGRLPSLDPATRAELVERIGCPEDGDGWAGHSVARAAAEAAMAPYCTSS